MPAGSRWHPKARQQPPSCGLANAICCDTDASHARTAVPRQGRRRAPCNCAGPPPTTPWGATAGFTPGIMLHTRNLVPGVVPLRDPAYPRNLNSPYQTPLQPMGVPPRLGPLRTGGPADHATEPTPPTGEPEILYPRRRKAIAATPCLRAGLYGASHLCHTMLQPRPTSPHPTSSTLGARAQRREPQRLGHDEPQSHEPSLAQARRPPIALARPTTNRGSSRTLSLGPDGSTRRPHYHGRFEEGPPLRRLTPLTGSTLSTLPPSHQSSHRAAHLVTILAPASPCSATVPTLPRLLSYTP